MEKTREIIKEVKQYEHSFYCDECNKYLGTSKEYDDGWYDDIGEFEMKFYIDGWYCINKHLCDECRKSFIENVKVALRNMGFEKDK